MNKNDLEGGALLCKILVSNYCKNANQVNQEVLKIPREVSIQTQSLPTPDR